jgi:hypothetical protein
VPKMPKLGRVVARNDNKYITIEWLDDEGELHVGEFRLVDHAGPPGRWPISNKPGTLLNRLREHFDIETCNEEHCMVIDAYEEDRRHAALEIEALWKENEMLRLRLEAAGVARPTPPAADPKAVLQFPSTRAVRPTSRASDVVPPASTSDRRATPARRPARRPRGA